MKKYFYSLSALFSLLALVFRKKILQQRIKQTRKLKPPEEKKGIMVNPIDQTGVERTMPEQNEQLLYRETAKLIKNENFKNFTVVIGGISKLKLIIITKLDGPWMGYQLWSI